MIEILRFGWVFIPLRSTQSLLLLCGETDATQFDHSRFVCYFGLMLWHRNYLLHLKTPFTALLLRLLRLWICYLWFGFACSFRLSWTKIIDERNKTNIKTASTNPPKLNKEFIFLCICVLFFHLFVCFFYLPPNLSAHICEFQIDIKWTGKWLCTDIIAY